MTDKPDLRQRRRLAMQAEIEEAALDLFDRQGFERTTVDDIAAAAGISPSTFFRHFPAKEDAVLGVNRAFEAALTARLENLPDGKASLSAFEDAVGAVLGELDGERADLTGRMLRVRRLAMKDPALRNATLRGEAEQCRRFLGLVVAATGSEAVDTYARVLAEVMSAGLRAAFDEWAARREAGRRDGLADVYRATCANLRDIVAG
ncbi:TetR/AcrR family transcriptional regulator [Streptomyces viridiviolaceus]